MTREEMDRNFQHMMAKANGSTSWLAEKVLIGAFNRLAECQSYDIEEAAAYLAYDKGLTYDACCEMKS